MAAAAPALRIEPLSERHERESFASGVAPLDRYLRQQAAQDTRRRVASCFVLITESDRVPIGYFTLAATGITLAELPEPLAKRLPRFPRVPAILMGRLAIDARHQRQGHGEFMLLDALSRALRNEIASYAFVVDANDDNAVRFYQCFGFRSLTAGTRRRRNDTVPVVLTSTYIPSRSVTLYGFSFGFKFLSATSVSISARLSTRNTVSHFWAADPAIINDISIA